MALQPIMNNIPGWTEATATGFDVTQVDTAQLYPIGMRVPVYDTSLKCWSEVIYCRGAGAGVAGDAMQIAFADEDGILIDDGVAGAEIAQLIGWLLGDVITATYGWAQIWGRVTANVAAGFADNGLVYATTTAGTVDDAAGGGQILNARSAGAIDTPATGQAYIDVAYASIAGTAAGLA